MRLPPSPTELPPLAADRLPDPQAYQRFHPFLRGVFSQWHVTPFEVDGIVFNTAEQWMMTNKAVLFGDRERAAAIMASGDPAEQKRLGQIVGGFDSTTWDHHKLAIVFRGNIEKFKQNTGARRQLSTTADAMLVEANRRDWIWGCGLAADDPNISTPGAWLGENLLGRILTLVRDTIQGAE
jgi:ribA/ribD-fused uncharacterized protein